MHFTLSTEAKKGWVLPQLEVLNIATGPVANTVEGFPFGIEEADNESIS